MSAISGIVASRTFKKTTAQTLASDRKIEIGVVMKTPTWQRVPLENDKVKAINAESASLVAQMDEKHLDLSATKIYMEELEHISPSDPKPHFTGKLFDDNGSEVSAVHSRRNDRESDQGQGS